MRFRFEAFFHWFFGFFDIAQMFFNYLLTAEPRYLDIFVRWLGCPCVRWVGINGRVPDVMYKVPDPIRC